MTYIYKRTLLQDDIKLLPQEPVILVICSSESDEIKVKSAVGDTAHIHFGYFKSLDYLAGICINKVYFVDTDIGMQEFLWLKTRVRKPYGGQVGESKTTKTAVLYFYDGEISVENI